MIPEQKIYHWGRPLHLVLENHREHSDHYSLVRLLLLIHVVLDEYTSKNPDGQEEGGAQSKDYLSCRWRTSLQELDRAMELSGNYRSPFQLSSSRGRAVISQDVWHTRW